MSKKAVLHVALLSIALGCMTPSICIVPVDQALKYASRSTVLFLFVSAFMLVHRQPDPNFKPKGSLSGMLDTSKNWQEYKENAYNVFWDRWIGQQFKDNTVTANKVSGEIKLSKNEKCLPYGVMGNTAAYLHEGSKAKELLASIGVLYLFINNPEICNRALIAAGFMSKPKQGSKAKEMYYQEKRELLNKNEKKTRTK